MMNRIDAAEVVLRQAQDKLAIKVEKDYNSWHHKNKTFKC